MQGAAKGWTARQTPSEAPPAPITDKQFNLIRDFAKSRIGITLADNKRHMFCRRVSQRLRALGLDAIDDYCDLLEDPDSTGEIQHLINALTTNKTDFFRESHHFDHLAKVAVPNSLAARAARQTRRLRIWSAGCSSGQEPYSIAMTLANSVSDLSCWDSRILATDINTEMVDKSSRGIYKIEETEDIPADFRERFVERLADGEDYCRMAASLRSQIVFKPLNLFDPWPMKGPFDVVFCRNVVIYFDKSAQCGLFDRIANIMRVGSFLYIGHSESLFNVTDRFRSVGQSIYQKIA